MKYFLTFLIVPFNLFSCDFCIFMEAEILKLDIMMEEVFYSNIPNPRDTYIYLNGAKDALECIKYRILEEHGHFN